MAIALDISIRLWAPNPESCEGHVIVPKAFIYQYPQCAQRLIETAGLRNIEIIPPEDYPWPNDNGPENLSVNASV